MKSKYITVLDFEAGRVFQYEIEEIDETACDYERFLNNNGHNLSNCEWMIHSDNKIIIK